MSLSKHHEVSISGGFGDCTFLAHQLPLYVRRGYKITVACARDKAVLFKPCGVTIHHERREELEARWHVGWPLDQIKQDALCYCNIPGANFGSHPLPWIGETSELWPEFCDVKLDVAAHLSPDDWLAVQRFTDPLPRPLALLHSVGDSHSELKSLTARQSASLYGHLLDAVAGTVLVLDWDNRVPRLASYRLRHLLDDWNRISIPQYLALVHSADLMIGIDSGPLHAVRYTDTPAIGLFPTAEHYPVQFSPPRARQVNLVPRHSTHLWNRQSRAAYNILECGEFELDMKQVATACAQMLIGPRYLGRNQLGGDLLLQQLVGWCQGGMAGTSIEVDRHRSLDCLLRELRRFVHPRFLATACCHQEESWTTDGFFTYLLALAAWYLDGELVAVDPWPERAHFSRQRTRGLGRTEFFHADPPAFIARHNAPVDVLYIAGPQEPADEQETRALREVQLAQPLLTRRSLIVVDGAPYSTGRFSGRGGKAVTWLLRNSWRILYAGYQVVLERTSY